MIPSSQLCSTKAVQTVVEDWCMEIGCMGVSWSKFKSENVTDLFKDYLIFGSLYLHFVKDYLSCRHSKQCAL